MNYGQPIFILPEGTLRSTGKDAQSRNIAAAKAVADSVELLWVPREWTRCLLTASEMLQLQMTGQQF